MTNISKDLYTPTDVKVERKRLYDLQDGIDPITKEKMEFSDSVCDHDHISQHTRAALHRQSNAFEGLVFNAYRRCLQWLTNEPLPVILRNLADYLEQDYSNNPHHPAWLKRVQTDFKGLKEGDKTKVLKKMQLEDGKNGKERFEIFKKALLTKQYDFDTIKNFINNP